MKSARYLDAARNQAASEGHEHERASSPEDDAHFMTRALELACATQLGRTAPNPSVGCVLVAENAIVGEGATG